MPVIPTKLEKTMLYKFTPLTGTDLIPELFVTLSGIATKVLSRR
jgi:hypothetical protein